MRVSKRFGGWAIVPAAKLKSSLGLKIFLALALLLFSVSLLLYGVIGAAIPASYRALTVSNCMEQMLRLTEELEQGTRAEAEALIYDFCLRYNAVALLQGADGTSSYGTMPEARDGDSTGRTISAELSFTDAPEQYILIVSVSEQAVSQAAQTVWSLFPSLCAVILPLSLGGAWLVSRRLTRPILEISGISRRLAALDMTWRCDTRRTDEIGVLAANLNTMAERLDRALGELTEANRRLQEDIRREREREQLRLDFFRAVSHELKTPITILKGELEGMIYQVGEFRDRDTHLTACLSTAEDMEALVREILAVSRAADPGWETARTELEFSALARACCRTWQSAARNKRQRLLTELEEHCPISGDAGLLEKALSNLIGNAVLHSPEGAEITVRLRDGLFTVTNSGVSIDSADLPRLFEPFYRGDSSHSRRTGGSGLGLTIAKAILDRHGFSYSLENTPQGVRFSLRLTETTP